MTGIGAVPGKAMADGINLFMSETGGKIAGRPVQLIIEDDESNPTKGSAKVRKLIDKDQVDIIAGFYFSSVAYAAAPVVDSEHVPCVIAESGADNLTQRKQKHWVVRTAFTGSQPTHPFGEYAAKVLHYKKVVTIASDYPYGHESVGGFQDTFEKSGGKIIQKLWLSMDSKDFHSVLKSVSKDTDAVFVCTSGQSSSIFPKQYKESGLTLPIIGTLTTFDESFFPAVGQELLNGISANVYSTALPTAANKTFVKNFSAKYGAAPGWFAESGYTCGLWIKKALEARKGDTSDKEKLLAALRAVKLQDAPRGPMKLDEYGNPIENVYIRRVDSVNGNLQNTVIYTYPNVSQFWKSKPSEYLALPAYSKEYPPCDFCGTGKNSATQ